MTRVRVDTRTEVDEVLERTLRHSEAHETEVLYLAQDDALTRFANSQIHQNVAEHDRSIQVRVIHEQRTGVASTNRLDEASLRDVVERATAISRRARPNPKTAELPDGAGETDPELGYVARTAEADPEERGRGARAVIAAGGPHGLTVSGSFATGTSTTAVANSRGLRSYHRSTRAALVTVMLEDGATGYANAASGDVGDIDAEALGREAADKAVRSRGAEEIEPGEYEVVLEEYAVATALEYLSYIGFSALAYEEERSFMELGKQVMGANVSIWDDGCDPSGLPTPIDYEGVPKQRVDLIERGVAKAVVHDAATASRAGVRSTGHALPAPNVYGPYAWNLFMAPGEASKEDMLASIGRGVWVTRFHYVNPVHPKKAVLTGMTKDGTFLVENGRFVKPILNMRFTQPMLDAFSSVEAISSDTRLLPGDFIGGTRAPAVKLGRFNFTGVTRRDG
ncbi:MAG: TldD/PmbA family protein [Candidatus Limnocylindria bacterium]